MAEAVEIIAAVDREIGRLIPKYQGGREAERGNSHGWIPPFEDPGAVLEVLREAVVNCGYEGKVAYALDCAASEMYDETTGTYYLDGRRLDADGMIGYIKSLTEKFDLLFVEDVLDQSDWDGHARAARELKRTLLIADDLTVTRPDLIDRAHELGAAAGFIFKPNQVGTVTEALEAHARAQRCGMLTIPSQRGGGTIWDDVMEIGIGIGAQAAKSCAPRGGESIWALNWMYRVADQYPDAKIFDFTALKRF